MAKTVDGVEVLTGDVDNQSAKSDILARLDKLNIKFEDKIKILPEATVKGPWALVSISVACVRGAAASGAELTSQAIMARLCESLNQKTECRWCRLLMSI